MEDDDLYYRRQGFWLRMARERAGKSQEGAAKEVGLAEASKSTISDYERGKAAPQSVLRKLARWYGAPIELFNSPPILADEVIERLMDELSRGAGAAERRDWDVGLDQDPASDAGTSAELRRHSA
jgi:transcriptional regulator with XRE-family HTH domain